MPQIELSDETFKQLSEFSRFSQAASDTELPLHKLADYLIQVGIDYTVTSILAPQDAEVLLKTILQMGRQYPEQTYGCMADIMLHGNELMQAKAREQFFGFRPPEKPRPPEE